MKSTSLASILSKCLLALKKIIALKKKLVEYSVL